MFIGFTNVTEIGSTVILYWVACKKQFVSATLIYNHKSYCQLNDSKGRIQYQSEICWSRANTLKRLISCCFARVLIKSNQCCRWISTEKTQITKTAVLPRLEVQNVNFDYISINCPALVGSAYFLNCSDALYYISWLHAVTLMRVWYYFVFSSTSIHTEMVGWVRENLNTCRNWSH